MGLLSPLHPPLPPSASSEQQGQFILGCFREPTNKTKRERGRGRNAFWPLLLLLSFLCLCSIFILMANAPSLSGPHGGHGLHRGSHASISLADKVAPVSFHIKSYNSRRRVVIGSACRWSLSWTSHLCPGHIVLSQQF